MYIVVEDENDCVPLTVDSSYTGYVSESSHAGVTILQVKAEDDDKTPSTLFYKILFGDPGGLFQINSSTGKLFYLVFIIFTCNYKEENNEILKKECFITSTILCVEESYLSKYFAKVWLKNLRIVYMFNRSFKDKTNCWCTELWMYNEEKQKL